MAALDCNGSSLTELMDLFACKETGGVSYPPTEARLLAGHTWLPPNVINTVQFVICENNELSKVYYGPPDPSDQTRKKNWVFRLSPGTLGGDIS